MSKFRTFKKNVLATLIGLAIVPSAYAGVVRDDVDYQLFRDFAENKGKFTVKRNNEPANIEIFDKNGKSLGVILQGVPMPDFSFADRNTAVASLVHPQYIASVAHNSSGTLGTNYAIYEKLLSPKTAPKTGSQPLSFGGQNFSSDANHYPYYIVDRNDSVNFNNNEYNDDFDYDYNMPRLYKMVTEVKPINIANTNEKSQDYLDRERFPVILRLGSGVQVIQRKKDNQVSTDNTIAGSYEYLIGGSTLTVKTRGGMVDFEGDITDEPLSNVMLKGDSGSPIIAFDKKNNEWVIFSTLSVINSLVVPYNNGASLTKNSFLNEKIKEDIGGILDNQKDNQKYLWFVNVNNQGESKQSSIVSDDGVSNLNLDIKIENDDTRNWQDENGTIQKKEREIETTYDDDLKALKIVDIFKYFNHGKDLYIRGKDGILELQQSINQGAGGLHFETDFTVRSKNMADTWLGSGISVAKDKTVTWQVKNPENDRLSKIGEGTLLVNGTGENKGDISVGDGTVILNQKNGYAFNRVGIVSGRPTVKLENGNQVNPDNIYFGYRGGRLDLNGNNLAFNYIQNIDDGAMIVNHSKGDATVTIKGKLAQNKELERDYGFDFAVVNNDIYWIRGKSGAIFDFNNPQENLDWVYIGKKESDDYYQEFKRLYNDYINKQRFYTAFNGILGENDPKKHNGVLNVVYDPSHQDNPERHTWLLSGGSYLNGDLSVKAGNLILSGRPTPYAIDAINRKELFKDDDWIDRAFKVNNLVAENKSKLFVGRNVENLIGHITFKDNSVGEIGFINGQTPVCIRSDHHGETECQTMSYGENVLKTIPITKIIGDITLSDEAKLTLGKAHLLGKSRASENTYLTLGQDAKWTMTSDSSLGNLVMENGSEITLNEKFKDGSNSQFNTLTIQGNLTGDGKFNYLTNIEENKGDKVVVKGIASGNHTLNVKDTGSEPNTQALVLLDLQNQAQTNNDLNVTLNNQKDTDGYVDLGAWRYKLEQQNNQFVLVSNKKQQQTIDDTGTTTGGTTDTGSTTGGTTDTGTTTGGTTDTGSTTGGTTDTGSTTGGTTDTGSTTGGTTDTGTTTGGTTDTGSTTGGTTDTGSTTGGTTDTGSTTGGTTDTGSTTGGTTNTGSTTGGTTNTGGTTTGNNNTIAPPTQANNISRYTNAGLSELSAQANTLLHIGHGLTHQLLTVQGSGLWVIGRHYKNRHQSDLYRNYQKDENIMHIGAGHELELKKHDVLLGGAWSFSHANQEFSNNIHGSSDLNLFSLYSKITGKHGGFINADIGYGQGKTELSSAGEKVDVKRNIATASVNVGKTFNTDLVDIQPSMGVRYHRFSDVDYTLNGAKIHLDTALLTSYRAGILLEKAIPFANGLTFKPSWSSNYIYADGSNANINVNGYDFKQQFGRYTQHEIGLSIGQKAWDISLNASHADGNEIEKQQSIGFKLNYKW